jgi:hypothetical protein
LDRRGSSVLLIPLLAAFALFYPSRTERSQSEQTVKNSATQKKTKPVRALFPRLEAKEADVFAEFLRKTGPGLVADFLGVPLAGDLAHPDRRRPTQAQFLFATLPDPVDSGEPYAFDRFLNSIQTALFRNRYSLSRFYLPWQDCILGSGESNPGAKDDQGSEGEKEACLDERPFEYSPGIIVFTQPRPDRTDLLILYLIGETPTSGIQKIALHTALEEMSWFCGGGTTAYDLLGAKYEGIRTVLTSVRKIVNQPDCDNINILGPSFSGSAQSLDFALSSWRESQARGHMPSVKMVSGTATAINPGSDARDTDFRNSDFRNSLRQGGFWFRSMRAPSAKTLGQVIRYLGQMEPDIPKRKIALLSEGGTAPGREIRDSAKDLTTLVFPLHISQLRAASEKHSETHQPQTQSLATQLHELPLTQSLEEVNERKDALPPLSQLDLASNEQIMANLFSTISRERFRYVIIQATDVRDIIFLAKEIREHSPTTVLFLLTPDLLYTHPEVNASLRGSIVVSSYPLVNSNTLWSYPHDPGIRMQFPDQASEGIYNAVCAFLRHEEQMLDYRMPFEAPKPFAPSHAPLWISVVGSHQMWPLQVQSIPNEPEYMYEVHPRPGTFGKATPAWFSGLYPEGTIIFMSAFMALCIVFSLPIVSRIFRSSREPITTTEGERQAERSHGTLGRGMRKLRQACLDWAWWDRVLAPALSEKHRRGGELYLIVACISFMSFLMVALAAFLASAIFTHHYDGFRIFGNPWYWPNQWSWAGLGFIVLSGVSCIALFSAILSLLVALRTGKERGFIGSPPKLALSTWGPTIVAGATIILLSGFLGASWISQRWGYERTSFFTSLRSLDLTSGVSALLPLFLISMAGFIWATSSFHRVRMLEGVGSDRGFLCFAGLGFREIHTIEKHLRRLLQCPSFRLPASVAVLTVAGVSVLYLFRMQLVRSFESPAFYRLLGFAFFFVHLALWLGVLRFVNVWHETRKLLRHLFHTPMRFASKRYQSSFPALRKIDLATPAPSLAPLACSIHQARTLLRRAERLVCAEAAEEGGFRVQVAVGKFEFDAKRKTKPLPALVPFDPESGAMRQLSSLELARRIHEADEALIAARQADAAGDWRQVLSNQLKSQEALADIASEVSDALQLSWWKEIHAQTKKSSENEKSESEKSESEEVYRIGEEFLVGRIAHFLGHVLPQMQNLIYTSIAGLLLMLFAVSSYPFQPHNLLLLFNWVVILSFVGTAMWVFVQMNRDPILSNLNGTKPGKITWDREFVLRIFFYGIVPILALLGAQFPDTVGQLLSHLAPAESMHP